MDDQMKISEGGWVLVLAYYTNEIKKDASEHLSCQPPYTFEITHSKKIGTPHFFRLTPKSKSRIEMRLGPRIDSSAANFFAGLNRV
jgi:hypothetical protein